MTDLSRGTLLRLLDIWLLGCKHDTEEVYEDCKKCPSRVKCKKAKTQIRKLIQRKISREFVRKIVDDLTDFEDSTEYYLEACRYIADKLKEVGIEVEEK